jgi:GrpB-like predicted nucleotidyltransferase (UPF0157 family)
MKGLFEPSAKYYERFSTAPVVIKPFDARSRQVASDYAERLRALLDGLDVEIHLRGSTAFGIAGKGDIEFGVYPEDKDWAKALGKLEGVYGEPGNCQENYVRFNDSLSDHEIEVIVLRGYEAVVDRRLADYLLEHPELLREYEQLKRNYAFSRREYQRQKDRFFRRVVASIPDE